MQEELEGSTHVFVTERLSTQVVYHSISTFSQQLKAVLKEEFEEELQLCFIHFGITKSKIY
jgi:hypothetical protein